MALPAAVEYVRSDSDGFEPGPDTKVRQLTLFNESVTTGLRNFWDHF